MSPRASITGSITSTRSISTRCNPSASFTCISRPFTEHEINSGCVIVNVVFPQIPDEIIFYGSQEAEGINGSKNGLFPSSLDLAEAGKLFSATGASGEAELTGTAKMLGTEVLGLLTAK